MSHTPGPWRIERVATLKSEWSIDDEYGEPIAITMPRLDEDQEDANARLIAAAPDLLAALEMLADHAPSVFAGFRPADAYEQARAAIAKAKGGDA